MYFILFSFDDAPIPLYNFPDILDSHFILPDSTIC